jgi:hypothetical protein
VRLLLPALIFLCAATALLPFNGQARAQDACVEPPTPAPVDGATLSEDQMRAAAGLARGFIAQSDVYQACLADALDAAKAQAVSEGKPRDTAVEAAIVAKAAANQKLKEKVGAEINAAIGLYKKTHLK